VGTKESWRSLALLRKNDGNMTTRMMKSGNFVKVVEGGASTEKRERLVTSFLNK
jgi:hypothetical protein